MRGRGAVKENKDKKEALKYDQGQDIKGETIRSQLFINSIKEYYAIQN